MDTISETWLFPQVYPTPWVLPDELWVSQPRNPEEEQRCLAGGTHEM